MMGLNKKGVYETIFRKQRLKIVLIAFLLFSIGFSFYRYFYFTLDGDITGIVLPCKGYETVLKDPFGINVILHDSIYAAPNRFFVHWFMSHYFKTAPLLLQHFVSPLDSVYLACAFIKIFIQIFLIYILSAFISGKKRFWHTDFLLAASIITPFFQISGYYASIGIIDHSITYTFFYAGSLSLVLLFFLPFFNAVFGKGGFSFSRVKVILLLLLSVVISFSGPLNTAVVLIIGSSILFYCFIHNFLGLNGISLFSRPLAAFKKIPVQLFFISGFAITVSLYSFYVGRSNAENFWKTIPITERYSRLLEGLRSQFTDTYAFSLILLIISLNVWVITKYKPTAEAGKILTFLKWILVCSVIYILFLPFGGYRAYRPNIIRWDTIMPVTLALILFYGLSTHYVIKNVKIEGIFFYYLIIIIFAVHFIKKDMVVEKVNECERSSLEKISQSPDSVVFIDNGCWIMYWGRTTDPNESQLNMELLRYWGVIKEKKLFYQPPIP